MKKITQTVLVALSLLVGATAMQVSAQTTKAPVKTRPAVVRERPGTETKDDGRMVKARSLKARGYARIVNVNTASSAQLRRLPNVGPQTAASIVRNRPYRNVAQFRSANKGFISPLEWRKISRRVRL